MEAKDRFGIYNGGAAPTVVLDELSQLDGDSAEQFLDYLDRCRHLWGMSVVIAEHRLDKLAKRVDRYCTFTRER